MMQTTRGISAAMASSIPAAARGGLRVRGSHLVRVQKRKVAQHELNSRDENGSGISTGLLHGFGDIAKDREAEM